MLAVVAEIVEEQCLQPNGLVCGCVLDAVVRHGDMSQTASQRRRTLSSAPHSSSVLCACFARKGLNANVVLFMILLDVPMQTQLGVMDEVARLSEPVEVAVAKAPPSFLP